MAIPSSELIVSILGKAPDTPVGQTQSRCRLDHVHTPAKVSPPRE